MATRILIADYDDVFRAGLVGLLYDRAGFKVAGEAGTSEEALRLAVESHPDLVLMDLSLPEMGGIEATRRIHEITPGVQVLILTQHEDIDMVRAAIQAGAGGYILKWAVRTELVSATQAVMRGDLYVQPGMRRALMARLQYVPRSSAMDVEPLSLYEVDVFHLIVRGYTNRQIARILSLSVRTVEYHRANLTSKLNLHSRVDLIRYAAENGIN